MKYKPIRADDYKFYEFIREQCSYHATFSDYIFGLRMLKASDEFNDSNRLQHFVHRLGDEQRVARVGIACAQALDDILAEPPSLDRLMTNSYRDHPLTQKINLLKLYAMKAFADITVPFASTGDFASVQQKAQEIGDREADYFLECKYALEFDIETVAPASAKEMAEQVYTWTARQLSRGPLRKDATRIIKDSMRIALHIKEAYGDIGDALSRLASHGHAYMHRYSLKRSAKFLDDLQQYV